MLLLLLLTCSILLAPQHIQATPLAQVQERRVPFVCAPILGGTHLSYRDCINALHLISDPVTNPHDVILFGSGPGVQVRIIHGDPLVWNYGTCEIHLQTQGDIPQLCSWQRVRSAALLLAHECAVVSKAGWMYIDRYTEGSGAVAPVESPGLQLWMGPVQGPVDEPTDNQQKSCSINERKGKQITSGISSQLSSLINAAKGRFGSGRTLLNDTASDCFSVNNSTQYNVTGMNGP